MVHDLTRGRGLGVDPVEIAVTGVAYMMVDVDEAFAGGDLLSSLRRNGYCFRCADSRSKGA